MRKEGEVKSSREPDPLRDYDAKPCDITGDSGRNGSKPKASKSIFPYSKIIKNDGEIACGVICSKDALIVENHDFIYR